MSEFRRIHSPDQNVIKVKKGIVNDEFEFLQNDTGIKVSKYA